MNHLQGHPHAQDEEYVRRIICGGPEAEQALKEMYLQHRHRISGYIAMLIKRFPEYKGQPEDLLHDSFIVLIRRIENQEGRFHSLFAYWMGISRLLFLNQLKKDERIILVREPEEIYNMIGEIPEVHPFEHESLNLMEQSFDQLGSRCKEILLMWIDRYPMHEIARRLNLSGAPMARKIKHECFKKLKNLVKTGNKWPG